MIDASQVVVTSEATRANLVVGGDKDLVNKQFTVEGGEVSKGPVLPAGSASMQTVVDEAIQSKFLTLEKRLDQVEKTATKAQKRTELRLTGADVNTALSTFSDKVEQKMSSSMEQFSKSLDGRFREMAAQQIEAQKKADQDRWAQFKELPDMLAQKSPKGGYSQSDPASWKAQAVADWKVI